MYKLYEHLLDGGGSITLGLGKDIKKPLLLIDENEPRPLGYRDITSIVNLDLWGHKVASSDYLRVRSAIVELIKQKALANCFGNASSADDALTLIAESEDEERTIWHFCTKESSATEGIWVHNAGYYIRYDGAEFKKEPIVDAGLDYCNMSEQAIAIKYSIVSVIKMLYAGFKLERILKEGKDYHLSAIAARQDRLITASLLVWNIIPYNAQEVIGTCINPMYGNMYFMFKEFGVKGSTDDYDSIRNPTPGPGILNYIDGTGIWEGTGIAQKNWQTVNGQPIEEFAKDLANILR